MAKILVTGSKGTLGKPLVRELERRGHDVWGIDLQHQADDKFIRADVASYRQLERVFEQDYDYVYQAESWDSPIAVTFIIPALNEQDNLAPLYRPSYSAR